MKIKDEEKKKKRAPLEIKRLDDPDQLLTVPTCAQLSQRQLSTWRKDIAEGRVPIVRLGRQVRIRRVDFQKLIASGFRPALPVEIGGHDAA